ncbi:hypothetical protein QNI16_19075 [Cytophagaceae bacterium YF14B1]|uniref:Uncharacterized protein n=1 Tax=Xanthocytophaga flava TaxID=3048013 RepID=A0AAE3U7N5_9BACT|nr:hypothetical protein [Xanthocytophaga flavus]MDJ1482611.1 hypothetical protein [Xanthocytophaga flavus]
MSYFTDEEVEEIRKKLNITQDFDTYKTQLNDHVNGWSRYLYRQEFEFASGNFSIFSKEKLDQWRLKEPAIDYILDKAIQSIVVDLEYLCPNVEQKLRAKLKE